MIQYVHIDFRFGKQLSVLRQAGKKAALAADKTEDIISRLKKGTLRPEQLGNTTKHGELRIKGCMKYDLGSGYRLVTLKAEGALFVLFAGTHDDCHRWIENNRELSVDDVRRRSICVPVEPAKGGDQRYTTGKRRPHGDEADDALERLDDSQMRILFSGLIQSVQDHVSSS